MVRDEAPWRSGPIGSCRALGDVVMRLSSPLQLPARCARRFLGHHSPCCTDLYPGFSHHPLEAMPAQMALLFTLEHPFPVHTGQDRGTRKRSDADEARTDTWSPADPSAWCASCRWCHRLHPRYAGSIPSLLPGMSGEQRDEAWPHTASSPARHGPPHYSNHALAAANSAMKSASACTPCRGMEL